MRLEHEHYNYKYFKRRDKSIDSEQFDEKKSFFSNLKLMKFIKEFTQICIKFSTLSEYLDKKYIQNLPILPYK